MPILTLYTNPFIIMHPNPFTTFYSYTPSAPCPYYSNNLSVFMVLGISYANVLLQDLTMTLYNHFVAENRSKVNMKPIFSILKLFSQNNHVRITCKTSYCKK